MNQRERTKQTANKKGKRLRSESSSAPEQNFSLLPGNRYLFRDDEAHRMYLRFTKRSVSGCYYFDPKGKIPLWYLTKINNWINHFSIGELATIPDTYSDHTTRLFYANLRFESMEDATSYFHGRVIDVSLTELASLLGMSNSGHQIYPHKNWPRGPGNAVCQETVFYYRNWFGYQPNRDMYVTKLPALHRVAHLLVNNILTPKSKTKTNIENGALFYMKHMIAMDEIALNIPYVLVSHMHKAHSNSKDSLPYGNLIHLILKNQGIDDALDGVPEDERRQPKNILDYFSDWHKTDEDMLVPNQSDPRNTYLISQGAAPNQYYPLGEQAPQPEPEPEPEPEPAPQAASSSQTVTNEQIMTYLTAQFQGINEYLGG